MTLRETLFVGAAIAGTVGGFLLHQWWYGPQMAVVDGCQVPVPFDQYPRRWAEPDYKALSRYQDTINTYIICRSTVDKSRAHPVGNTGTDDLLRAGIARGGGHRKPWSSLTW